MNWWLRDVVSGANFANVNWNGNADCNNASNPNGVRPDFEDAGKTWKQAGIQPKGKAVPAIRLNESMSIHGYGAAPCRSALCGKIRQADSRGLTLGRDGGMGTRYFDMDNKIADLNVLYDAFLASMKGSSWKEEPQKFEIDFLSEIVKLKQELEAREYRTMPGSEFTLNERGKTRHIHGGRMRDRVVRHALCDTVLDGALKPCLIYNNSASQKGKGVSFARKAFERDLHNYWLKHRTNDGYVGFVDFSKFYDNIRHDKVKEMVSPRVDEFSGWLFGQIVDTFRIDVSYMDDGEYAECMDRRFDSVKYYENISEELRTGQKFMAKSVDIGDQVSQDIGIFYPVQIDNYAKIVRRVKMYGRYMDDIYIIGETKEYVESVIQGIGEQAQRLGIFINERKTRIVKLSQTFKYLQVKYSLLESGKVVKRINPKSVTRERRKLKAYKRLFDKGNIEYGAIEQAYKSWMGSHVPIMSKSQVKNMKQLYRELFGKEPGWKKQK